MMNTRPRSEYAPRALDSIPKRILGASVSTPSIIIIGTITVVTTYNGHIHLIEHSAYHIFVHTGRISQRILHGFDFRAAPFNDEKIRIYEVRDRKDIETSNKRRKIHNHIIVFLLER